MKKHVYILVLAISIFSFSLKGQISWGIHLCLSSNEVSCSNEYTLIFDDEFNGNCLDLTKWQYGFKGGTTMNNPNQYLGESWPSNYIFTGTTLKMNATHQPNNPVSVNGTEYDWTSCEITSIQQFPGDGGKFEIRCKIPLIQGTHPAFWLMGDCKEEVDIFEFYKYTQTDQTNIHRALPCSNGNVSSYSYEVNVGDYSPDDFHIYSVEWNDILITWSIDGTPVRTEYRYYTTGEQELTNCGFPTEDYLYDELIPNYHDSFVLVISNTVDVPTAATPSTFEIDYVRGYSWTP